MAETKEALSLESTPKTSPVRKHWLDYGAFLHIAPKTINPDSGRVYAVQQQRVPLRKPHQLLMLAFFIIETEITKCPTSRMMHAASRRSAPAQRETTDAGR